MSPTFYSKYSLTRRNDGQGGCPDAWSSAVHPQGGCGAAGGQQPGSIGKGDMDIIWDWGRHKCSFWKALTSCSCPCRLSGAAHPQLTGATSHPHILFQGLRKVVETTHWGAPLGVTSPSAVRPASPGLSACPHLPTLYSVSPYQRACPPCETE